VARGGPTHSFLLAHGKEESRPQPRLSGDTRPGLVSRPWRASLLMLKLLRLTLRLTTPTCSGIKSVSSAVPKFSAESSEYLPKGGLNISLVVTNLLDAV
jgi:hypothetical protein